MQPALQEIINDSTRKHDVRLYMLRLDIMHPHIQGNKWYKLKYNIAYAIENKLTGILSFGGAYSNHLHALAIATRSAGIRSIGVVRGYKDLPLTPTLDYCKKCGMEFKFLTKAEYDRKNEAAFLNDLQKIHPDYLIVPEGGNNLLGIQGCKEIVNHIAVAADIICLPLGSGGTTNGLLQSIAQNQMIYTFTSFKKTNKEIIQNSLSNADVTKLSQLCIIDEYHFGGFAKMNDELFSFIHQFYHSYHILLDPVYTSKMMYGIHQMISDGRFKNGNTIVCIHTGGLQAWDGFGKYKHLISG